MTTAQSAQFEARQHPWLPIGRATLSPERCELHFLMVGGHQLGDERQVGDLGGRPAKLEEDYEGDVVDERGPLGRGLRAAQAGVEYEGEGQQDADSPWGDKRQELALGPAGREARSRGGTHTSPEVLGHRMAAQSPRGTADVAASHSGIYSSSCSSPSCSYSVGTRSWQPSAGAVSKSLSPGTPKLTLVGLRSPARLPWGCPPGLLLEPSS